MVGVGGAAVTVHLDAVRCSCGRCLVLTAGDAEQWTRGLSARLEAVALAALRSGWLYYASTSAWSCPVCCDKSDAGATPYQSAVASMVTRVRKALAL